MTVEAILVKMLDIFVSNFLIAMGWITAIAICLKVSERGK